jgi:two-component system, chemotaxis family, protein-glutamate methylesterase/glutaminase
MDKIKVLVVDDSAIVRDILTARLSAHPDIEVVASAMDPFIARKKLESLPVDVVTLDIEMPKMDGLTFLKYLMKYQPMPVIVLSSLGERSSKASVEALSLGAIEVVKKPGGPFSVEDVVDELVPLILATRGIDRSKLRAAQERIERRAPQAAGERKVLSRISTTQRLIAVGASTGGTVALQTLFDGFRPDFPPALAVIHMPEKFTASFAERLDSTSPVHVKEAEDGETVMPATVYIAPGGLHMTVKTVGKDRIIRARSGPKVYGQRPSVDILFESVAQEIGQNAIGVLLTGMGRDGAQGMVDIRKSGGHTIAQDEASSIVFGMPKEAIDMGGAVEVAGLDLIAGKIGARLIR